MASTCTPAPWLIAVPRQRDSGHGPGSGWAQRSWTRSGTHLYLLELTSPSAGKGLGLELPPAQPALAQLGEGQQPGGLGLRLLMGSLCGRTTGPQALCPVPPRCNKREATPRFLCRVGEEHRSQPWEALSTELYFSQFRRQVSAQRFSPVLAGAGKYFLATQWSPWISSG